MMAIDKFLYEQQGALRHTIHELTTNWDRFTDQEDMEACYLFLAGRHVLYVGESEGVYSRIYTHLFPSPSDPSQVGINALILVNHPHSYSWQVEILPPKVWQQFMERCYPELITDLLDRKTVEKALIHCYRPPLNTQFNPLRCPLPPTIKDFPRKGRQVKGTFNGRTDTAKRLDESPNNAGLVLSPDID